VTVTRWLVVGAAPDAALAEEIARRRGAGWVRLEGQLLEERTVTPVVGAEVVLSDHNDRAVALATSTVAGYALMAPPGDYVVAAEAPGRRGGLRLEVSLRPSAAATTMDVLVTRPGDFSFEVTEGGRPSPARLTFLGVPPTRTPHLGPPYAAPGGNVALTADGRGRLALAPGRYRVVASRGPAFTVDERDLTVEPGVPAQAAFELRRAVELPGMLCADLHQHAAPSFDSMVSLTDRALTNLAEGLDLLVATDHNAVADYAAALSRLGAARSLVAVPGTEASREGLGQWAAYPLPLGGSLRHGAPEVSDKNAHQIVAALRGTEVSDGETARAPDRIVQLDRPRDPALGYFNAVGLDPRGGPLPKDWEGGFDALEVFSSKDISGADAPLADWFSLLNRGLGYVGVGGSDSHLVWGEEVGYPRTCVTVGEAEAAHPSAEVLVAALKRRREVLITNGPFVRMSVGGHAVGQLAPAPRGRARLDLEVLAAPWVDVRHLEVFVNGGRRGKPIEIPAGRGPLRWKGAVDLRIDRDSYVVVTVRGDTSLEPVLSHPEGSPAPLPLAITNPIFLDRDGDGKYSPPNASPRPTPRH
jgi:hypothetical protein